MARPNNSTGSEAPEVLVSAIIPNADGTSYVVECDSETLPTKKQESGTHERTFATLSKEIAGSALSIDHMRGRQTGVGAVMFALAKPVHEEKVLLADGYAWCSPERAEQLRAFAHDLFKLHTPEEGK